jgi:tetratricopeptide (TPR) repeat protein
MGVWTKYSTHLAPMMDELRAHIPRLRALSALHYPDRTNWKLDPQYDYNITVGGTTKQPPASAPLQTLPTSRSASTDISHSSPSSESVVQREKPVFLEHTGEESRFESSNVAGVEVLRYADPKTSASDPLFTFMSSVNISETTTSPTGLPIVRHTRQSVEGLLNNISARATFLASSPPFVRHRAFDSVDSSSSSSPNERGGRKEAVSGRQQDAGYHGYRRKHFAVTEVQRVLRNNALDELYHTKNFAALFRSSPAHPTGSVNVNASLVRSYISQLRYRNSDVRIDELVAVGYVFVSTQKFAQAVELFDQLLEILYFEPVSKMIDEEKDATDGSSAVIIIERRYQGVKPKSKSEHKLSKTKKQSTKLSEKHFARRQQPLSLYKEAILIDDRESVLGISVGLGTSLAYLYKLTESICVFTDALKLNPVDFEILKRRSEVYTSLGSLREALEDLDNIIVMAVDSADNARPRSGAGYQKLLIAPADAEVRSGSMNDETLSLYLVARYDKGKILVMQGKFKDALTELTEVAKVLRMDLSVEAPFPVTALTANVSALLGLVSTASNINRVQLYFLLGKCHMKFGETHNALGFFNKSLALDEYYASLRKKGTGEPHVRMKETHVEAAFTHMEAGNTEPALKFIASALKIDPAFKLAYGYRGLFYQNMGQHAHCTEDFLSALRLDATDVQVLYLGAMCFHATGNYNHSYHLFQRLLQESHGKHIGWFRMEAMLFAANYVDVPLADYNIDRDLSVRIRDGLTLSDINLIPSSAEGYVSYAEQLSLIALSTPSSKNKDGALAGLGDGLLTQTNIELLKNLPLSSGYPRTILTHSQRNLIDLVTNARISEWIQLSSPGFITNKRIHTSFGLSALAAAQALAEHVYLRHTQKVGLLVKNSAVSKLHYFGVKICSSSPFRTVKETVEAGTACVAGYHVFGWRDYFDIIVKWRQVTI